ncbi:MAG: rhomboid family intramembrane serine protease [Candidatus Kapaibacterium sp.]|nr:MAG: rhomboid family intramembrane serine protease [Candidatus Kapabacteria bacterium]
MKLDYNAPVVLTFTLLSAAVMVAANSTGGAMAYWFSTQPGLSWSDLSTYFRLFSHVFGHANWDHLFGNFTIILLVGPLLEEKYGSQNMVIMIAMTALVTSLLNNFFFSTGLMGASGIVFMMILLSSFANLKQGRIPLTFVIIVVLFLGKEVYNSLNMDNISQFAHILGGICGSIFGFSQKDLVALRGTSAAPSSAMPKDPFAL